MEDIGQKNDLPSALTRFDQYEDYLKQFRETIKAHLTISVSPHDMVNVHFTSGSTGIPKLVAFSHHYIAKCERIDRQNQLL